MSKVVLSLVLLVVLLPEHSPARGYPDAEPGNLVVGYRQTWYWPPSIYLCPYDIDQDNAMFWVYGIAPAEPVAGVRFNVLSPFLSRQPPSIELDGAVDASGLGDDYWELEFDTCQQWPTGTAVALVRYVIWNFRNVGAPPWLCVTGPENVEAVWTTCSGATLPAGSYPPEGQSFPAGCVSADPAYCEVDTEARSWGCLKATY